jgi:hypothetical protein
MSSFQSEGRMKNIPAVVVTVALMAAGALYWYHSHTRGPAQTDPQPVASSAPAAATPTGSAAPSPLTAAPRPLATTAPALPAQNTRLVGSPSLSKRYETATDKRALFDELIASNEPGGKYFAAKLIVDCKDVADSSLPDVLNKFVPMQSADPDTKALQLSAFKRMKEPCAGFSGRKFSFAEYQQLRSASAQEGDPRGVAALLSTARIDPGSDVMKTAQRLLETNDPYVIESVAAFLGSDRAGGYMIGGVAVDRSHRGDAGIAWQLVACDFGGACGADNPLVLAMCAESAVCNVSLVEQLYQTALASPDSFERAMKYREQILADLRNKNFASLGLDASRLPQAEASTRAMTK